MATFPELPPFTTAALCASGKACGVCQRRHAGKPFRDTHAQWYRVVGDDGALVCGKPWEEDPPPREDRRRELLARINSRPRNPAALLDWKFNGPKDQRDRFTDGMVVDAIRAMPRDDAEAMYGRLMATRGSCQAPMRRWLRANWPHQQTLFIRQNEGLGDVTALSGALRDLHLAHPGRFRVVFRGWAGDMFRGCPWVQEIDRATPIAKGRRWNADEIPVECYLNEFRDADGREHVQAVLTRKLSEAIGLPIPVTRWGGDIRLTDEEKAQPVPWTDAARGRAVWLLWAGAKRGGGAMTVKQPDPAVLQRVVDALADRVLFVQLGSNVPSHFHARLRGTFDHCELPHERTFRKGVIAAYHADGILSPISWGMWLAASVELPSGRERRAAVVMAGGRETRTLIELPNQTILDTIGELDCCERGACWKERVEDGARRCLKVLPATRDRPPLAACMAMPNAAERIVEAIENYL